MKIIAYFLFIVYGVYEKSFGMNCYTQDDMILSKEHPGVQHLLKCYAECIKIPSMREGPKRFYVNDRVLDNEYRNLPNLNYVLFPDNIEKIGKSSFSDCDLRVLFLNNVKKLGESCFSGNRNLELVIIPETEVSFGKSCFSKCGDYSRRGLTIITNDAYRISMSRSYIGNWYCRIIDFKEAIDLGIDKEYNVNLKRFIK